MNHSSPNSASRPSPPSEGGATRAAERPARVPAGGKEPARAPDTSSVSQRSQIAPDGADGAARHPCLLKVAGLALRDPRARPSGRNTFIPHFALRTPRFLPLLLFLALLSTARAQDTTPPQLDGSTQTNTAAAITNAILYGGVWYNPLFYPPAPAQPVLSQADAIAAAWTLYQATNSTPSNQVSAPMAVVDAASSSGLHPTVPGSIRVDAASNRAIADYGPSHVSWASDITDPDGTVDMLTPAGQELKSYVAGLYYLSADGQSSALIASLQSSTAQVVLPSQILYSDAFVSAVSGASAGIDVLYNYDLYSMSQDLVMRRQIPPPSAFSASLANPYAPDLRLGVITVFPGLTQQPTLVPAPVNPDDYGPSNPAPTEPDTDIIFAGARMVTGHAFLAGNNPTPIFVVKSWQYINQNWCLVESVQLSQVQTALGQLPPATASLTPPQNGGATRAAGRPARVPAGGTELASAPDASSVSQRSRIAPDGADGAARPSLPSEAGLSALRTPHSAFTRPGGSLALPTRPSPAILHPPSSIQFARSLPSGPALVWDYVIVNEHVMDFVFGPRTNSEIGFAAVGYTSSDVWNKCATNNTTYTSLVWSDNTSSATSLTVSNAPGNWGLSAITDVMYQGYVYSAPGSGNVSLVLSNLASGNYNFYLYGHGAANNQSGSYSLVSGSQSYGSLATAVDSYSWNSNAWQQGEQFVVFLGVSVSSNSPVTINATPDPAGYSLVNGMQIVPSASSCLPGPSGLVSWWQAENNANDAMGTNNASYSNVGYASGVVGEAFDFYGSTNYIEVPASASLNVGTNSGLTIACWIQPADFNIHPLVEWNAGSSAGTHFWIYGNYQGLFANFLDTGGTSHQVLSPGGLVTNTGAYAHVATTYDGTNAVIYYNGGAVVTTNFGASFTPQTTYNLYFGLRPGLGMTYYNGLLDDVSLYNRALSSNEVHALYLAGLSTNSVCVPPTAPTITTQPASQTVTVGNDSQPFTVVASGTPPLSYQWQFNGANISGATGTSYSILNVQAANAGSYAVIVSNPGGSTTSSIATLTTNAAVAVARPSGLVSWWQAEGDATDSLWNNNGLLERDTNFIGGKVGQAFNLLGTWPEFVAVPASASLNVGTNSGLTLECWIYPGSMSSGMPLVEWNNDPNYGTSPGVHFWIYGNPNSLYANFIDTHGTTHDLKAPGYILTGVDYQHVAVSFDNSSGNAVLYCNGQAVTNANLFSSSNFIPQTTYPVYLGLRPDVQWFEGGLDEVSLYNRALSASEILGIYNAGSAGKTSVAPTVAANPTNQTVAAGYPMTMPVTAAGSPPFAYQWQLYSTNLAGATSSTLSLPFLQPAQAGGYRVIITNSAGSVTSSVATLTVGGPPLPIPGMVWIWGDNTFGESVTPGPLTNLAAVAAGYSHTLILQQNGTILAWGNNNYGQATVPTGLTNVVAIAAGEIHSLALSNGTVVAWGNNTYGQTSVPGGLSNVVAIAASGYQSMALRSNGTVTAWGTNYASIPSALTNGTSFVTAIAAGDNFCLALLANGTVTAWGNNTYGQTNVPTNAVNVVAVAAGGAHALALKANGTVVAWGSNGDGESTPPTGLTNVMAVAAGFWHSLALKNDGTVVGWGDNSFGQTGFAGLGSPTPLGGQGVKAIAAGELNSLALEFSPLVQYYPLTAANDLLLIYNTNSSTTYSSAIMNYYRTNRPMVANANVLALNCTTNEAFSPPDYATNFVPQVQAWLAANPTKRPQYVILLPEIPSRVNWDTIPGIYDDTTNCVTVNTNEQPSVQYQLATGCASNWTPFVTSINMNGSNDCIGYINKLVNIASNYSPGKLIISAGASGVYANTNFYFDDAQDYGYPQTPGLSASNSVIQYGAPTSAVTYSNIPDLSLGCNITRGTNLAGYLCWGTYSMLGSAYPTNSTVQWTGNSAWYLIETIESFNGGRYFRGQSFFLQWFAPNAFGGSSYSNTPVGAVCNVDEPCAIGYPDYFGYWQAGYNFAICAWNSRNSSEFQAVGDPFVRK